MQDGRRGRTCERPLDGAVDAKADTDAVVAQGQRAVTAKRAARVSPAQHRGRKVKETVNQALAPPANRRFNKRRFQP